MIDVQPTTTSVVVVPKEKPPLRKRAWKSFRTFPMIYIGSAMVLILVVLAVFAPWIAPLPVCPTVCRWNYKQRDAVFPKRQIYLGDGCFRP